MMNYNIPSKYKCYLKYETLSLSELLIYIKTKDSLIPTPWLNPVISIGKNLLEQSP